MGDRGVFTKIQGTKGNFTRSDILKGDFSLAQIGVGAATVYYRQPNYYSGEYIINEIEKVTCSDGVTYYEKCDRAIARDKKRRKQIAQNLLDKQRQLYELRSKPMKMLIKEYGADEVLGDDVRKNKLLVFMLIVDNAYGMEIERFRDAILLDSRNESQAGRNEFGMGLKTAASWFGKVWRVTSTQYGSSNRYTATVDIPMLDKLHLQNTKIYRDFVATDEHGTEIVIEQVTKKITGSRTIGKIRDLLSSMYRRDINNRNIEIWFNDEPIVFEEYPILTNFRGKSWKKNLDFNVDFDDKMYHVTGFVAIMNPGSFPKAGFALFRQDRVVIGGTDSNYKPSPIFGQAQSQKSLKLFGELNMNDFPVNQAKDGFIWDDGLEDAFIDAL